MEKCSFVFLFKIFVLFMCMKVLPVCMSMHTCIMSLWKTVAGITHPRMKVTVVCSHVGTGNETLELWIPKPSL